MICVSVGEKKIPDAIAALSCCEFGEIRLDLLEQVNNDIVKKIFISHSNLIATFRRNGKSDSERLSMLGTAVKYGASYIDADINESLSFIDSVKALCSDSIGASKKGGTQLIISYHNYNETPGFAVLDRIITQSLERGADIVKIACDVSLPSHTERLLSLPEYYRGIRIVLAGMGTLGGRVRILSHAAGSFFTYASLPGRKATAEGQLDYNVISDEHARLSNVW